MGSRAQDRRHSRGCDSLRGEARARSFGSVGREKAPPERGHPYGMPPPMSNVTGSPGGLARSVVRAGWAKAVAAALRGAGRPSCCRHCAEKRLSSETKAASKSTNMTIGTRGARRHPELLVASQPLQRRSGRARRSDALHREGYSHAVGRPQTRAVCAGCGRERDAATGMCGWGRRRSGVCGEGVGVGSSEKRCAGVATSRDCRLGA